jgi:hypothetical protein
MTEEIAAIASVEELIVEMVVEMPIWAEGVAP